jgi:hypothetical protein
LIYFKFLAPHADLELMLLPPNLIEPIAQVVEASDEEAITAELFDDILAVIEERLAVPYRMFLRSKNFKRMLQKIGTDHLLIESQ